MHESESCVPADRALKPHLIRRGGRSCKRGLSSSIATSRATFVCYENVAVVRARVASTSKANQRVNRSSRPTGLESLLESLPQLLLTTAWLQSASSKLCAQILDVHRLEGLVDVRDRGHVAIECELLSFVRNKQQHQNNSLAEGQLDGRAEVRDKWTRQTATCSQASMRWKRAQCERGERKATGRCSASHTRRPA